MTASRTLKIESWPSGTGEQIADIIRPHASEEDVLPRSAALRMLIEQTPFELFASDETVEGVRQELEEIGAVYTLGRTLGADDDFSDDDKALKPAEVTLPADPNNPLDPNSDPQDFTTATQVEPKDVVAQLPERVFPWGPDAIGPRTYLVANCDPDGWSSGKITKPYAFEGSLWFAHSSVTGPDSDQVSLLVVEVCPMSDWDKTWGAPEREVTYRKKPWGVRAGSEQRWQFLAAPESAQDLAPDGKAVNEVFGGELTAAEAEQADAYLARNLTAANAAIALAKSAADESESIRLLLEHFGNESDVDLLVGVSHQLRELGHPGIAQYAEDRIRVLERDAAEAADLAAIPDKEVLDPAREVTIERDLTDADYMELAKAQAQAAKKAGELDARLKSMSKQLKGAIEVELGVQRECADTINSGKRKITVACRVEFHQADQRVHVTRLDTGECIEIRELTAAEKQLQLDFGVSRTNGVNTPDAQDRGWADEDTDDDASQG